MRVNSILLRRNNKASGVTIRPAANFRENKCAARFFPRFANPSEQWHHGRSKRGGRKVATNQITGGEAMVRMLKLHGVNVIFGLCGDTRLPFYDALYRTAGDMTHVLTRAERHAG